MGWSLSFGLYFVIWWVSLMIVLPFGIQSQHEAGEVVAGSEPGAPVHPYLLRRVLANTVLAAVIWGLCDVVYIAIYLRSSGG
jgi:predicted secreted protein